jgi:hypothetical protein
MNKSRFRCIALLAFVLLAPNGVSFDIRPLKGFHIVQDSHGGLLLFTGFRCDRIVNGVVSMDVCQLPVSARLFSTGGATFAVTKKGLSRFSVRNGYAFTDVLVRSQLNYYGAFGNDIFFIDEATQAAICWSAKSTAGKWEIPCRAFSKLFLGEKKLYLVEPLNVSRDVLGGTIRKGPYRLSELNVETGAKESLLGADMLQLTAFPEVLEAAGEIFIAGDGRVLHIGVNGKSSRSLKIDDGLPSKLIYVPTNVYAVTVAMKVDKIAGRALSYKLYRLSGPDVEFIDGIQVNAGTSSIPVKTGTALFTSEGQTELVDLKLRRVIYRWPGECKYLSEDKANAYTIEGGKTDFTVWNCSVETGGKSKVYSFKGLAQ